MVERLGLEQRSVNGAEKSPRHCIIIPGIQATKKGMFGPLGIHNAFVEQYGDENVTTFTSLISTDNPNPQHFDEIADAIMERGRMGPLDIVMLSLGSTDFAVPVYKRILRKDRHFFEDPQVKEHINFYIKSGSGSSKGMDRIAYPIRFIRLVRDVGLDTVYAFPPEGISASDLTKINAHRSNKRPEYITVPFLENEKVRTNEEFLNLQEREAKNGSDSQLRSAKSKMNYRQARKIIKNRKKILEAPLQDVYDGTPNSRTKKERLKIGGIRGAALLIRALGSKSRRRLIKLFKEGYPAYTIISEFEQLIPIKRAEKFYRNKEDAKRYIRVIEGSTHTGDALQAGILAKTIFELREQ